VPLPLIVRAFVIGVATIPQAPAPLGDTGKGDAEPVVTKGGKKTKQTKRTKKKEKSTRPKGKEKTDKKKTRRVRSDGSLNGDTLTGDSRRTSDSPTKRKKMPLDKDPDASKKSSVPKRARSSRHRKMSGLEVPGEENRRRNSSGSLIGEEDDQFITLDEGDEQRVDKVQEVCIRVCVCISACKCVCV